MDSINFNTLLTNYQTKYSDCAFQTSSPSLAQIKDEFQLIKTALNHQHQQLIYNEIKEKIEDRNKSLKEISKLFYKKILEKYNNIHIDRLLLNDNLFTEHDKILNAIKHY